MNDETTKVFYKYCFTLPREQAQGVHVGDRVRIAFQGEHPYDMVVAAKKGKQSLSRIYLRPIQ